MRPSADRPLRRSKPSACSSAWAASSRRFSLNAGPAICRPTGRPVAEPAGDRDRRDPGQRHRHGAEVVQVHRQRIAGLLAEPKATVGAVGVTMKSTSLEGAAEVLGDLRAHPLRAAVVGVVVARGERVGAEHDPPLDLRSEAVVARARVHRRAGPSAPSRAARSARRRSAPGSRSLGGREHVVGRQRMRRVRQPDLARPRAELLARARARLKAASTPASIPSPGQLLRARPGACRPGARRSAARSPPGTAARSQSHGSRPTMWREQQRGIASHRASAGPA